MDGAIAAISIRKHAIERATDNGVILLGREGARIGTRRSEGRSARCSVLEGFFSRGAHRMFEQGDEQGWEVKALQDRPEEGGAGEPARPTDGFRSYSLEVLRLLED